MATKHAPTRPPILVAEGEADALADLAVAVADRHPLVSRLLLEELDRAELRRPHEIPPDVVTMGATIEFMVEETREQRTVELVYPRDADIAQGRVSILTPVGAGLLGLRAGQSIAWPDRGGHPRTLTIVRVVRPD
ncbi:nucleoside diphosphate kinase regulator [Parafrankia sp. BMG5.11]|uniref:nucleoside diphosphate kinase regulator n=1 Tax=Parafrankia sp. BMG5.11 TaxID=222540 RepID=UPI00103C609B|nr:nucleoside diphosphate kinase regulator [Parafrankia sp. BMG5.11]TCJ35133.1 nucleoside diphosphate kinase regulator [Parafrankia sp. BMG5.11]